MFEAVIVTFVFLKDVDHNVEVVHQNPLCVSVALDLRGILSEHLFHSLVDGVAKSRHMRGHVAGGDDEEV